ncbi:MAG: ATP-dependent zinc metalloprotease FtsH [Candidatus Marinimicrobia bacterium]|nr:ATP-dependent zinc metalloprotease FtsH [Candidatus Neomarinimicrobiota bacterium]
MNKKTKQSRRSSKPQKRGIQQPDRKGDKKIFNWKQAGKTSIIWIVIIIAAIFLSNLFTRKGRGEVDIQYYEYQEYLKNDLIEEATIMGNNFHGKLKGEMDLIVNGKELGKFDRFVVILPYIDESVLAEWDKYFLKYSFKNEKVDWSGYLFSMAPWLLLIAFWIFLMRRMQGGGVGGRGIFSFGKSRAKLLSPDMPKTNFTDVAGCEEAKTELMEIIQFLKNPKQFQKLGGKIPKGALLLGPPGTGKTLLARAVAGEAGVPFFSLSGADFVEMFVGVGASRVRDLYDQGKKAAPSIIFIDEIDAVGRHRGAGLGGGHDEREQTLNQLLVEMDGFEGNEGVIVIAATNRPDVLDPALLRPGRFDRQIIVDIPDLRGRLGIFKVHTKNIPMAKNVDLKTVARGTPGLVGSDIANIVNEAALLAARKKKSKVNMVDFEDAKDRVMMGIERKSMILSEEEKKLTAYHESGHALVANFIPYADPVHKVTIIPRGRALGLTAQLPIDEKHNYPKSYIEAQLAVLMGGRAAENLIFNELSTGAGNDIEHATEISRKMVCEWGMSEKMGPLTFGKKNEEIFLGKEIATRRDFSETTSKVIDEEISKIVRNAEAKAKDLLQGHVEKLHDLASVLLEYETIDGEDLKKVLSGEKLKKRRNLKSVKKKESKQKGSKQKATPQRKKQGKKEENLS